MQTDDFSSIEADPGAVTAPALTILYHPDLHRIGDRAMLGDLSSGVATALSRDTPVFAAPRGARALPLEHTCVSRTPLLLTRAADGTVRLRREESRTKVVHRGRAVEAGIDVSPAMLRRGAVLTIGGRIVVLLHRAGALSAAGADDLGMVGESDGIQRVRADVQRVADLDVPVLVRGETGTGKELVAKAIHQTSGRRGGPFVAVNLGAVAPELAVAELFGAERGAFTGAVNPQPGYFSAARGGTLFLDEIGEAPPSLQATLLRVLATGEIQRVGAQRAQHADVRIIAATDADLEAKIRAGTFRAPLLHRLSSYEIATPPLRERRDDIGRLLVVLLREELARVGEGRRFADVAGDPPWLPTSLVARLAELDWPGNIRQLQNVVRQMVIGSRGQDRIQPSPALDRLLADAAPRADSLGAPSTLNGARTSRAERAVPPPAPHPVSPPVIAPPVIAPPGVPAPSERRKPAETSDEELDVALRAHRWDLAATAAALRLSRASLYVLIQKSPRFHTAGSLSAEEITRCHGECGGDVGAMVDRLEVSEKALLRRLRELGLAGKASPAG